MQNSISMPLVSVIIPCFNAQAWIKEALLSIISQGISDIEVIVVDDGSTDGSADIVEREFPLVRLVRTANQGRSRARNLGIQLAKGEYIQFLDADDILAPGKLSIQLDALKTSGADIAYGSWKRLCCIREHHYAEGELVDQQINEPETDLLTCTVWCPPAVYLFRRSIVERVGGWLENLPLVEDVRFMFDCACAGAQFVYCPALLAYYREYSDPHRYESTVFSQCCLKNAEDARIYWLNHGGLNHIRIKALLYIYGSIARAVCGRDKKMFDAAYQRIQELDPSFVPEERVPLYITSKILGYKNAEYIAFWYRRVKIKLRSLRGHHDRERAAK